MGTLVGAGRGAVGVGSGGRSVALGKAGGEAVGLAAISVAVAVGVKEAAAVAVAVAVAARVEAAVAVAVAVAVKVEVAVAVAVGVAVRVAVVVGVAVGVAVAVGAAGVWTRPSSGVRRVETHELDGACRLALAGTWRARKNVHTARKASARVVAWTNRLARRAGLPSLACQRARAGRRGISLSCCSILSFLSV
jgi:hypothetical protein